MLKKEKVIAALNSLPEKFSVDEAIEELLLLEKIENGLQQSVRNEVISDGQLDQQLPEWLS